MPRGATGLHIQAVSRCIYNAAKNRVIPPAHLSDAHPRPVPVKEHVRVHHAVALRLSPVGARLHVMRVLRAPGACFQMQAPGVSRLRRCKRRLGRGAPGPPHVVSVYMPHSLFWVPCSVSGRWPVEIPHGAPSRRAGHLPASFWGPRLGPTWRSRNRTACCASRPSGSSLSAPGGLFERTPITGRSESRAKHAETMSVAEHRGRQWRGGGAGAQGCQVGKKTYIGKRGSCRPVFSGERGQRALFSGRRAVSSDGQHRPPHAAQNSTKRRKKHV